MGQLGRPRGHYRNRVNPTMLFLMHADLPHATHKESDSMPDRGMDIILVEDDTSMRHAMQRMLQAAGCFVTSYESAEALLEIGVSRAKECDCLVFDISMPGISGLDLCRTLLANEPCPPCILITGHDAPGLHDLAIRAGARDYLLKPFKGADLLSAIKRAVAE